MDGKVDRFAAGVNTRRTLGCLFFNWTQNGRSPDIADIKHELQTFLQEVRRN
jgi:hypothetical protein